MNIQVAKSNISGTIRAPASKSYTHRALVLAALANGTSRISNILLSDDTRATINALLQLGVKIEQDGNTCIVIGTNGTFHLPHKKILIDAQNSGTTLRFITALSCLADGTVSITGSKRLQKRPIAPLSKCLSKILDGGHISIDASKSSQFLSALLLISPFAKTRMSIEAKNLISIPYVDITIDLMKHFGVIINRNKNIYTVRRGDRYVAQNYEIEGDYSSSSYLLAAAAITGSKVQVTGLNPKSIQGDRFILDILNKMGYTQQGKFPQGIEIDMNKYPDLVPTVAVLAAYAKGKTVISNIKHLRLKESDRIKAIAEQLFRVDITVKQKDDTLIIIGGVPKGAVIQSYNDHRIAMAFAVLGLNAKGKTVITDAEVVNKSYPNFWSDFTHLGVNVKIL